MLLPMTLFAQVADAAESLSSTGMTVMVCSVGAVICMLSFCLFKVMTLPPVESDEDEYDPPRSLSM